MAKYTQTIDSESKTIKHEFIFMGKTYDYTMSEQKDGIMKADKPCFSEQIEEAEDIDFNYLDIHVDLLDCEDESGAMYILEQLEGLES